MKLSVLIPVFNGQEYVTRCLKGVLHQNIHPSEYEIILIDDGSDDNTYQIAREFAKEYDHIKVLTQENKGLYNTRNRLLSMARGDFIYNLDVDDLLVENQLSAILDLAYSRSMDVVGFASKEALEVKPFSVDSKKGFVFYENGEEFILAYPNHRIEVWWYIVSKRFLEENQIGFVDNPNNADVLFTYQILLNCKKMAYFDSVCHYYYQSKNSIMRNTDVKEKVKLINTMYEMILSLGNLVNKLKEKKGNSPLVDIIGTRLNHFVLANVIRMIRTGFNYALIKQRLHKLKSIGAYPIRVNNSYKRFSRYKMMAIMVNNDKLVYLVTMLMRLWRY